MAWMKNKQQPETRPMRSEPARTEPGAPAAPKREISMEKLINIGQSIEIRGELHGNEDLTIEGKVDGKITLKGHSLTIGANGKIKGEIFAKSVLVIGEVSGNVTADDKIELAATGSMLGDIRAPRVALADGARFKGAIDMDSGRAKVADKPASSGQAGQGGAENPSHAMSAKRT